MGHGKETPRQKMIGMMYLVLTALLALNVSKDVLNAFLIVNNGLQATNQSFKAKNSFIYNQIAQQGTLNPAKVKPVADAAHDVERWAKKLNHDVHLIKRQLIMEIDGIEDTLAGDSLVKKMKYVQSKDNYDDPTRILLGHDISEMEHYPAHELKNKLIKYRDDLKGVFSREGIVLINEEYVLEQLGDLGIDTEGNPHAKDDHPEEKHWEYKKFYHTPLWATITILTQIQSEILNAESIIIEKLYGSISASDFKFNTLEAIVIPNTDYVLQGGNYEAEVFLAAYDTAQQPDIYVGSYDENNLDIIEVNNSFRKLEVDKTNNRGIFSNPENSIGDKIFRGFIQLKAPTGEVKQFRFNKKYKVAAPNLVVSPTKMNVFYLAIENPVRISIPGVDELQARINNGDIKENGNEFIVVPKKFGKATITVFAEEEDGLKRMGEMEFRVKRVPDPEPVVGGLRGGGIEKSLLTALNAVYAPMPEWFDFDLQFTVTGFTVSYTDRAGFTYDEPSKSKNFTQKQKDIFKKLNRGAKFNIEDITAVGPDGGTRNLGALVFKIK